MVLLRVYKHEMKLDNTWAVLKTIARTSPGAVIMITENTATIMLPPTEVLKIPKTIIDEKRELTLVLSEVYGKVVIEETKTYWNISHAPSNTVSLDSLIFRLPLVAGAEEEEMVVDVSIHETPVAEVPEVKPVAAKVVPEIVAPSAIKGGVEPAPVKRSRSRKKAKEPEKKAEVPAPEKKKGDPVPEKPAAKRSRKKAVEQKPAPAPEKKVEKPAPSTVSSPAEKKRSRRKKEAVV